MFRALTYLVLGILCLIALGPTVIPFAVLCFVVGFVCAHLQRRNASRSGR